jgi:hypothetical protein
MSVYFFSEGSDGEKKAMAGVKAIVIPKCEAKLIKKAIAINKEEPWCSTLKNYLTNSLKKPEITSEKQNITPEEQEKAEKQKQVEQAFREEYNHFRCLSNSKVAFFFHIRNIVLRLCYSSFNKKQNLEQCFINSYFFDADCSLKSRFLYREIIGYYIDFANFYYFALPLIEAHHIVLDEPLKEFKHYFYADRLETAKIFLTRQKSFEEKDRTKADKFIADAVDRNYYMFFKTPDADNICPTKQLDLAEPINAVSTYEFITLVFSKKTNHLLYRPWLWFLPLSQVFFRNFKYLKNMVNSYFIGRLWPSVVAKDNCGTLPGILADGIEIDPVAGVAGVTKFSRDNISMESQESHLTPIEKMLSDLLWHILSRCAATFVYIKTGIPEKKIGDGFESSREFNTEWRAKSKSKEVQLLLRRIDNKIITEVADICKQEYSREEIIIELEKISLTMFHCAKEDIFNYMEINHLNKKEFFSAFKHAVNCTYMHV